MFKSIQKNTQEEIIALDPAWGEQVDALRRLDRENLLLCQGCRQAVRLRAGAIRIRHFAHKSRGTCTHGKESAALLLTRALLYQRLRLVFGETVTLEKQFDDKRFPRPVDCWVEREGMEPIAYWIVDTQIRPQFRDRLRDALKAMDAKVHWVFIADEMLRSFEERTDAVLLSTTERDLATITAFDVEVRDAHMWHGESLHYLDPKSENLTTFRGLVCVHGPQVYQGRRLSHPLAEVLIASKSGEFAHSGERERLALLKEELKSQKEEQNRRAEEQRLREEATEAALFAQLQAGYNARVAGIQQSTLDRFLNSSELPKPAASVSSVDSWDDREGVCVFCGERTRRWWTYYMGTCKCYACREKGIN